MITEPIKRKHRTEKLGEVPHDYSKLAGYHVPDLVELAEVVRLEGAEAMTCDHEGADLFEADAAGVGPTPPTVFDVVAVKPADGAWQHIAAAVLECGTCGAVRHRKYGRAGL